MATTSQKRVAEPWRLQELNRIVMAARTMPEFVGEIPGRHWWPALILLILDVDISAETAVRLPASALNPANGRISVRHVLYQLHAKTMEALNALPGNRELLLPWPKDSGRPPFHMLCRDYKTVLYRAGLPYTRLNSFVRLQVTTRRHQNVLDHIQPILDFVSQQGKPQLIRARDRREHAIAHNRAAFPPTATWEVTAGESAVQVVRKNAISPRFVPMSDNPESLLNLFRSKYRPSVLRQAKAKTISQYVRTVTLFYSFAGRELTFQDLNDELLVDFLTDCFDRGASAGTCNHYRADLLALWRFGWRKRLTNELPRDVPKLKVDEPLPDAWTTNELERILFAASQLSGEVCDMPANVWWPAFILTMYDTGLRFNALILRATSDLDMTTGWLKIDATDQKQRKAQALKLHSDTLELVKAMQPAERPYLFPWPYVCGHKIRDAYREILQAAGLPTSKRDLFHKLRRTSATSVAVVSDENAACDHLGHSSVLVTRRYLDRRQIQPVAVADMINRPRVGCSERG